MTDIRQVATDRAPGPGGHYSQALVNNGLVFVSGQLPIKPGEATHVPGGIEQQTEQVLHNLQEVLAAAGSRLDLVLKTTVYITDISLWGQVNEVYGRFFAEHRPARSIVPVTALHYGYQIELDAIAALA